MVSLKTKVGKLTSSEAFLAEATRDGRAVLQDVSMAAIGKPDVRLQPRSSLDMSWVRQLDASFEITGKSDPVVIFQCPVTGKLFLADGFHRHEFHKARRLAWIKAVVIPGNFKDAAMFAATANQRGCLPRKECDYPKILSLLFDAAPEWIERSAQAISQHTGISSGTITKYRAVYCQENGRSVPISTRVKKKSRVSICKTTCRGKDHFVSSATGEKTQYLGPTLEIATARAAELEAELERKEAAQKANGPTDLSVNSLLSWFSRRGVAVQSCGNAPMSGLGQAFMGPGFVASSITSDGNEALINAVGRVLLNKVSHPAKRMVVVVLKTPNSQAARNAASLGVEFLTPDELVASLTG